MNAPDENTALAAPKSSALQMLYWRSEILQVMYWLRGEGFGDIVDAPMIERFLGVDASNGLGYLERLVEEGYLTADGNFFGLSEFGLKQGARGFDDSFNALTKPAHGECSDDCWCHASVDEADACMAHRIEHNHAMDEKHMNASGQMNPGGHGHTHDHHHQGHDHN